VTTKITAVSTERRSSNPALVDATGYTVKVVAAAEHPADARRVEDAVQLLVKLASPERLAAQRDAA
jgi:hypothetical protein